jgi:hypothetical protein
VAFAVATSVLANDFDQESDIYGLISDFDCNRYLGLVSDSLSYTTDEGDVVSLAKCVRTSLHSDLPLHGRWSPPKRATPDQDIVPVCQLQAVDGAQCDAHGGYRSRVHTVLFLVR